MKKYICPECNGEMEQVSRAVPNDGDILIFQCTECPYSQFEEPEEVMDLLPEELKVKIPTLYSQENEKDPMVICKFFDPTGSWTWYVIEGREEEYDYGMDFLFFGYVVGFEPELGYFTLNQLETAKKGIKGIQSALPIERDLYFTPCQLSEIKKLHGISE